MRLQRHLLAAGALLVQLPASTGSLFTLDPFPPLLDATLDELRAGLDAGRFTSVDLTRAYTARIEDVNDALHAVTELNPDALAIAASLDRERASSTTPLGPLHGLPVLLKNNIGTADGMNNTAGSTALLGATLGEDSTVARKLREAGAVVLGKANLSQWAGARSLVASNGWSAHGGQTMGGYHGEQDPEGSSSGSAVAAALGLAWAALGTDSAGGVVGPASANNVVGVKPTVGLTSRFLVVPLSEHQDTVGPLARTVKDAAYLLQAIAGRDKNDNYTSAAPEMLPDYVAACDKDALRGKRLGVPRNYRTLLPSPQAEVAFDAFEATFAVLRDAGAEVIEDVDMPGYAILQREARSDIVSGADFLTNLPAYLAQLATNPSRIHSLADVRAYTDRSALEEPSRHDLMTFNYILKRGVRNDMPVWWEYYTRGLELTTTMGLAGALRNHSLDAIIVPSAMAGGVAMAGAPVVSVPLGKTGEDTEVKRNQADTLNEMAPNRPFGFSFVGGFFEEEKLIGMAYALEQRTNVRGTVRPVVRPRTELGDVVRDAVGEDVEL